MQMKFPSMLYINPMWLEFNVLNVREQTSNIVFNVIRMRGRVRDLRDVPIDRIGDDY